MDPEEPSGPRVSAVLVSFNQAPALRRAIAALEGSQDRERLEILVVDCGSQDESPRLDAEFPAVQILRLPQHFGATRAMNIAMRTAKAELVLLLSPDVEVLPDTVKRLVSHLDDDGGTVAVCPLLRDSAGEPVSRAYRIPSADELAEGALEPVSIDVTQETVTVEYASRDALLARKQFIRGMNYFDERFGEYWADLDLAMQIRRAGKKIRLYPSIGATIHPGTDPLQGDAVAQSDRILGAAELVGKYEGSFAGLRFRLAAILKALGRFDFRGLSLLVSGEKIGSQAGR
ncbi:MAG TPA: glycosyltransferase [Bryobacteraceae bacterium]|jgi:GT2 family glycosyltransferase